MFLKLGVAEFLIHESGDIDQATELTFDELKARLAKTVAFLELLKPAQIEAARMRMFRYPWAAKLEL